MIEVLKLSLVILLTIVCFAIDKAIGKENIVVIDDFEDGDFTSNTYWVLPQSSTGVENLVSEIVPGVNNTKYALSLTMSIVKNEQGSWATLRLNENNDATRFYIDGSARLRFWVKATTKDTDEMSIYILENDLTAWASYIELSTEWQEYILSSNNFTPLSPHPNINPENRKKREGTDVNLSNVKIISFIIEDGIGKKGFVIDEIRLEKVEELR